MTLRMNNNPKRNFYFMLILLLGMIIIASTSCSSYRSTYKWVHGCSSARGMSGYGR